MSGLGKRRTGEKDRIKYEKRAEEACKLAVDGKATAAGEEKKLGAFYQLWASRVRKAQMGTSDRALASATRQPSDGRFHSCSPTTDATHFPCSFTFFRRVTREMEQQAFFACVPVWSGPSGAQNGRLLLTTLAK